MHAESDSPAPPPRPSPRTRTHSSLPPSRSLAVWAHLEVAVDDARAVQRAEREDDRSDLNARCRLVEAPQRRREEEALEVAALLEALSKLDAALVREDEGVALDPGAGRVDGEAARHLADRRVDGPLQLQHALLADLRGASKQ
jgi:hypothetical protein